MNNFFMIVSTDNEEIFLNLCYTYSTNAKKNGWWDNIRFILWGPAQKLVLTNEECKISLSALIDQEIEVLACKSCSDEYGITDQLQELFIDVKYVGVLVSNMLKEGWYQLSF